MQKNVYTTAYFPGLVYM